MFDAALLLLVVLALALLLLVNPRWVVGPPWFLWLEFTRLFILLELAAFRLVRLVYPSRYVLKGRCGLRGACCKYILGDPPRFIKDSRLLDVYAFYHRLFHRFTPVAKGPNGEIIFSCGHLGPDNRCGIYRYRPLLCRNYPVIPIFEPPRVLPGCGYRVAPRVVAAMHKNPRLPILNPEVAVHHPTPGEKWQGPEPAENFHLVAIDGD